ncbi:MAG: gliding motility-associated protein GldE [Dysgonamonadaceae bacterium]|jgi:gliding motility-associated protein GldE|nr:gliding motility-associated protein GldE [Dysgonamonadaceae bacterium]
MDSDCFLSIFLNSYFLPLATIPFVALLIAVFLLYVSALLSGAEAALLSLSSSEKYEAEEENSQSKSRVRLLLSRSVEVRISLTIWNSLLKTGVIILTLQSIGYREDKHNGLYYFLMEIMALIVCVLLFGEVIPRIYAQSNPLKFLKKTSSLVHFLEKISRPLSSLIAKISLSLHHSQKRKGNDVSVDELSKALELTSDKLSEEKNILEGIINLYNKTAVEIMTPRMDVAALDISVKFKEVLSYIVQMEYSRIPVFSETLDEIKGILYIKDLLPYLKESDDFDWKNLIRSPFFVPEEKKIDDLLEEFRTNKNHIAIVVDEYGGTSGIVTMEDILEEIVGEINDEYDDEEELKHTRLKDGSFIFEGKILLTDFFRITHVEPKTFDKFTEEVDSLAGLILEIKGDFPEKKEVIEYGDYSFRILDMDNKRILKIKFQINKKTEEEK